MQGVVVCLYSINFSEIGPVGVSPLLLILFSSGLGGGVSSCDDG